MFPKLNSHESEKHPAINSKYSKELWLVRRLSMKSNSYHCLHKSAAVIDACNKLDRCSRGRGSYFQITTAGKTLSWDAILGPSIMVPNEVHLALPTYCK